MLYQKTKSMKIMTIDFALLENGIASPPKLKGT